MRKQLDLLWELQRIDLDLRGIKEERDRFPKIMKELDEKKKVEQERIQKEREKTDLLEKDRRRREGHLQSEQERIKRTEGRMFEVKTNKEYQALLTEIEGIKEAAGREEEEILQLLDEIEELKKDLRKREKELVTTLEKIESEEKMLEEKIAQNDRIWNKQVERREVLSKQLESKLFKLYNTLREKRQEIGVVGVRQETCQGCFVHIPPQMYIEVQKNNALIRCPNCNRILYWDGNGRTGGKTDGKKDPKTDARTK